MVLLAVISAGDVVLGIAVPLSACPLLCLTAERKSQREGLRAVWALGEESRQGIWFSSTIA